MEKADRPFVRAAGAGGQLLRVERLATRGGEERAPAFVFTFDVGRILLTVHDDALRSDILASAEDVPTGVVDAAEEEPWWRLLGTPLTRVQMAESGALELRFRHPESNPRTVRFEVEGSLVRTSSEG